ncbi:hypothetical protein COCHEDRAFT_1221898 [Bipolaris maydis C5]|uniref:Uncharacterized protein n=2 Tax=Cochliobolus heterostrophus TaxID=5016 RepID=M2URX8_COCH5|nr:hypothetical protein COCHEDRAFT_1221898 [Bipolaris maydis C5]KAJ5020870.1 hypothetical protein J3E73DRAFT_427821 [Bipolaris maydis]KAJ5030979.1 hypothetical protein J3E73DRAFT_429650 [Bipolaris maydis]KAJ5066001.1 hypothetical protein J3E74DRAFT_471344 [Bipolaris maydis]KAJ6191699.1 hypothetical protein J3E72DRAFT_390015 [Bipolaris maydis]
MHFSATLLAFAATASAAVVSRADDGQWFVQMSFGPGPAQVNLNAYFTSPDYPEDKKLGSHCGETPYAELPVIHSCDTCSFEWTYDNQTLRLSQHLPNGKIVYGTAEWPRSQGEANVTVSQSAGPWIRK